MTTIEQAIGQRYLETKTRELNEIDRQIAELQARRRQLSHLIDSVSAAERGVPAETLPKKRGKSAREYVLEVMGMSGVAVMTMSGITAGVIAAGYQSKNVKQAVYQAVHLAEKKGQVCRAPGGWALPVG